MPTTATLPAHLASVTLATLAPHTEKVADKASARPTDAMLRNRERVSPVMARIVCEALPTLTLADMLATDAAPYIVEALREGLCFRSHVSAPLASESEVQAAQAAGKVASYVKLPSGLCIALRPSGKEYRAGDIHPEGCGAFKGDAAGLIAKVCGPVRRALVALAHDVTPRPAKVAPEGKPETDAPKAKGKRKAKADAKAPTVGKPARKAPVRKAKPVPAVTEPAADDGAGEGEGSDD